MSKEKAMSFDQRLTLPRSIWAGVKAMLDIACITLKRLESGEFTLENFKSGDDFSKIITQVFTHIQNPPFPNYNSVAELRALTLLSLGFDEEEDIRKLLSNPETAETIEFVIQQHQVETGA